MLGWDPAFRTGCKLAVVDATGKVLDTTVIYPTAPQKNKVEESKKSIKAAHCKISHYPDLRWKRNGIERVGADHRGAVKRASGYGSLCDRK